MMNCACGPATDCSSRSPRRIRLGTSWTEHASQTADNRAIVMGVGIYEAGCDCLSAGNNLFVSRRTTEIADGDDTLPRFTGCSGERPIG